MLRNFVRVAALVLPPTFIGLALIGLALHVITVRANFLLAVAAFGPFLMAASPLALVLLLSTRSWWQAAVAGVVTALCLATQIPLYVAQTAPTDAEHLVVMTANLRLGNASAQDLVAAVRSEHVDVLTVQELTADEVSRLAAAGLGDVLPHSELAPHSGAGGSGIYSRLPLDPQPSPPGFYFAFVVARVSVPGVERDPIVIATHMPGPWPQSSEGWVDNIGILPGTLRELAAADPSSTILVGGDFNATTDITQFRRLLTDGYHDSADQAGAGHPRTYPADTWLPPLIAIDHVLTRNAVATSVRTVSVPGSDHRALLAVIAIPKR